MGMSSIAGVRQPPEGPPICTDLKSSPVILPLLLVTPPPML